MIHVDSRRTLIIFFGGSGCHRTCIRCHSQKRRSCYTDLWYFLHEEETFYTSFSNVFFRLERIKILISTYQIPNFFLNTFIAENLLREDGEIDIVVHRESYIKINLSSRGGDGYRTLQSDAA